VDEVQIVGPEVVLGIGKKPFRERLDRVVDVVLEVLA
jgi:hypothetical protein